MNKQIKRSPIEEWTLDRITPYQHNAKLHPEDHVEAIANSIKEFTFLDPVAVDEKGEILEGHGRLLAAKKRGDATVPVIQVTGLTEAQKKAYRLAHNKLTMNTGFDPELLKIDFEFLKDEGFDLDLTGFAPVDLEFLEESGEGNGNGNGAGDDDIPESEGIESRVQPGDIWKLGRHYIACADCTVEENVRKLLSFVGGRSPDMVFSDPPYGINIVATNVTVGGGEAYDIPFGGVKNRKGYVGGGNCRRTSIEECRSRKEQNKKSEGLGSIGGAKPFGSKSNVTGSDRASNIVAVNKYAPIIGDDSIDTAVISSSLYLEMFPNAFHCWWGGNYYAAHLPNSSCWIVWDKQNTGNFADAELAWTNSDTAVRIFQHMWNGMLKDSEKGVRRVHPSQKPLALFQFVAEKYGKPSDLTIDPFLGSGISLIGSEQMEGDRVCAGFEMSVEYCEIICQRFEKISSDRPIKVGSVNNAPAPSATILEGLGF